MNCKSCGRPILWAKSEKGANIPLDPTAVLNGNLDLSAGVAVYVKADPSVERYVSHFVTCPQASLHRKKKAPK